MANSVIFCQAPTKIPATLTCYEKELKSGNKVFIIIRNAKNVYDFFLYLKLKAKVFFFENINTSSCSPLFKRNEILGQVKIDIAQLNINVGNNDKVFFTDVCDDWIMGLYLSMLNAPIYKIQSQIDIKKKLDEQFKRKGTPFKLRLKEKIYSFVFRYHFIYTHIDHWTLALDIRKYKYPTIDYSDMSVCKRYLIAPQVENKHTVLFFTEPYRNTFQSEEDYMKINHSVIKELHERGYCVGVKGHPRIGLPAGISELADFEVPVYLPSEFIDLNNYDFVIGFVSTSICNATEQILAYSVLPMCDIEDQEQANYWYNYIDKIGNKKVIYLKNFNNIPNVCE